jgi:hypothetical protein
MVRLGTKIAPIHNVKFLFAVKLHVVFANAPTTMPRDARVGIF